MEGRSSRVSDVPNVPNVPNVWSPPIARYVFETGTADDERAQALLMAVLDGTGDLKVLRYGQPESEADDLAPAGRSTGSGRVSAGLSSSTCSEPRGAAGQARSCT